MADYETYRALLRINKHGLDEELMVQPDVMERISTQVAAMRGICESAHERRKSVESTLVAQYRSAGDNVADADAKMRVHDDRNALVLREQKADRELAEWVGLYEAWKARGYSLKELVSLYCAQYFATDPQTNVDRAARPAAAPRVYGEADRSAPRRRPPP